MNAAAGTAWSRGAAGSDGRLLVDLGTTTVSSVRAPGAPALAEAAGGYVGHPVLQTIALSAADTDALGSDFARAGLLYEPPKVVDETFTDAFGIDWLWADNAAAPLKHPLEQAGYLEVARYRRPVLPVVVQVPEYSDITGPGDAVKATRSPGRVGGPIVIADAPVSGLLETCFGLRGSWQFMFDITDDWRVANALLDWGLETVAAAYERTLTALPVQPDIVLYGDDYGYQDGMFLSDADFRTFVKPRLKTLFSHIRRATSARICFHCCGAVNAILPDLVDLGADLLNLQHNARGMELGRVRKVVSADTVLHGYTDLRELGTALEAGDRKTAAALAGQLAASVPAIAAPVDCLADDGELRVTVLAARFVQALTSDDLADLRRLGPVAAILDRAADTARAAAGPRIPTTSITPATSVTPTAPGAAPDDGHPSIGVPPTFITLPSTARADGTAEDPQHLAR